MPDPWPHQIYAHQQIWRAFDRDDARSVCVTSPTGAGKTRMMTDAILEARRRGWPAVLYTDRKLLTGQNSKNLTAAGIAHGLMSADYEESLDKAVQVASVQTVHSRVFQSERWEGVHPAKFVVVDEAHKHRGKRSQDIIQAHLDQGAKIVAFTATPVDLGAPGETYDELIQAGSNTDMLKCGAHVPATHYGCDEPDLKGLKRTKVGEFTEAGVVKAIMVPQVFGRVLDHYQRLNLTNAPTLLFAPGVAESRWFAMQFAGAGITSAHIDGDTPNEERDRIIAASKAGEIAVICNRFVLREGVDMPWLRHCIFATVFGALDTYLQAGGRMLRKTAGKWGVTIQDHGAHWWRFGGLNEDREWKLGYTSKQVSDFKRQEGERGEPQPICCPRCSFVRYMGSKCPKCGHEHKKSVRMVVQTDGTLKPHRGDAVKVVREEEKLKKQWISCLRSTAYLGRTYRSALGYFKQKTGAWKPNWLDPHLDEADLRILEPLNEVWPWLTRGRGK